MVAGERAADLPPDVARAVTIARAIEANPAAIDSILTAHGLTRAGLDSMMYAIAADSARNWRSAGSGCAPTNWPTSAPSRNPITAGMLRIPNACATAGA